MSPPRTRLLASKKPSTGPLARGYDGWLDPETYVAKSKKAALVIIDQQRAFSENLEYWSQGIPGAPRSNPEQEQRAKALLDAWRARGLGPVVHVRHRSDERASPLRPEEEGFRWMPGFEPLKEELQFEKNVNSGFVGTDLFQALKDCGLPLVVCGLTVPHCVSTTTRFAGNLGFRVYLVKDAVAAYARKAADGSAVPAEEVARVELAVLGEEFCELLSTGEVLQEGRLF